MAGASIPTVILEEPGPEEQALIDQTFAITVEDLLEGDLTLDEALQVAFTLGWANGRQYEQQVRAKG